MGILTTATVLGAANLLKGFLKSDEISALVNKFRNSIIVSFKPVKSKHNSAISELEAFVRGDRDKVSEIFQEVVFINELKDCSSTISGHLIEYLTKGVTENVSDDFIAELKESLKDFESKFRDALSAKQLVSLNHIFQMNSINDIKLQLNEIATNNDLTISNAEYDHFQQFTTVNQFLDQSSYNEYLNSLKSRFAPLQVLPDFIFNKLYFNDSKLFLGKENGELVVKDKTFYDYLKSKDGIEWNKFLAQNGVGTVTYYNNGNYYKIEKFEEDCFICDYKELKFQTSSTLNLDIPADHLFKSFKAIDVGFYKVAAESLLELFEYSKNNKLFLYQFLSLYTLKILMFLDSGVKNG